MSSQQQPSRISDEMLDQLIGDRDPQELFHSEELFVDLKRRLAERMLAAEIDHHLAQPTEQEAGNTRNGHHHKTVLTEMHAMPVDVPRDRLGSFEPRLIEKYSRRLDGFDEKVVQLFAHGMTLRPMQRVLRELYGIDVSPTLIATITDEVHEACDTWRQRPLERCYAIVYLDAIHVKLRESGSVDTHAVYLAIGIDQQGHKAVLGMWLGEKEGAKFSLSVLNDLKARGVEDILVAVVDGLKGFPDALGTAFPATTVQTCIVHLIRYSLSRAPYQERKALAAELKKIYRAPNADAAAAELDAFEASERGQRYPDVVRSWRAKWDLVIPFMAFSAPIRKVLYTTNAIESLNSSVRRAVNARGHFTSVRAAHKLIYLALREATRTWQAPLKDWPAAQREFAIYFSERFDASATFLTCT